RMDRWNECVHHRSIAHHGIATILYFLQIGLGKCDSALCREAILKLRTSEDDRTTVQRSRGTTDFGHERSADRFHKRCDSGVIKIHYGGNGLRPSTDHVSTMISITNS